MRSFFEAERTVNSPLAITRHRFVLGLVALLAASPAQAQEPVLDRGDAVMTGFSGTHQLDGEAFIDLDAASMRIAPLRPDAPPAAQVIVTSPKLQVKARDVGQVFSIALDDGLKRVVAGATPNIYLGATAAFGLQIVDASGKRIKRGQAQATWMPGQFGRDGGPGSVWRVDGASGDIKLFATIPGNSGPGIGDIVYDTSSLRFYVSDLDSGLIQHLDSAGNLIESFDHGVKGRPAAGLPAVADDGKTAEVTDAAFDAEDAKTWGITQRERRVWGLGLYGGRLYYAVASGPEIWSVSLKLDGSFGDDPRREFEVSGTPANHEISDIAFDAQGMMYVAQRGGIRGSYDFAEFTEAKKSVVFRYRRELPDDPATPGGWVPVPEEFAVGFPPDHRNTTGGIALGYGYDEAGRMRMGACGAMLWTTGESLRVSEDKSAELEASGPTVVHGLQGVDRALVRPDNEPPMQSYFVDYDSRSDDPGKTGQVGDVEIWQPCDKASFGYGPYAPLPYLPPAYGEADEYPPGWSPPVGWPSSNFNLRVDKAAVPLACAPGGLGFLCTYTVRVTNTGPDPYIGPITVNDKLPAVPAGATMTFDNQPPWACIPGSPTDHECTYNPSVLWPGSSVDLKVTVDTPAPAPVCTLDNIVQLKWPWGFADSNPADDFAGATAGIPAAHCPPVAGEKANLKIYKTTGWGGTGQICTDKVGHFACTFLIGVVNTGPGTYNGPIKIEEQIPAGTTVTSPNMVCSNGAPATCEFAPVVLAKLQSLLTTVTVKVPKHLADDLGCKLTNKVKITDAAGGTDQNSDATDDEAEAEKILPGTAQQCPDLELSNLKIKKTEATGAYCPIVGGNWECKFNITVQNFGKPMENPVRFIDALPPGSPAGTTIEFQPPAGWQCDPSFFPLYVCKSDNPKLSHMEKAGILATVKVPIHPTIQCSIKNTAIIITPPAPAPQNTFGGDDTSDATAYFEQVVPQNGNPFCAHPPGPPPSPAQAATNLSISKTAGSSSVTGAGQTTPFVITVTNSGPGLYNGPVVVRETLPGEPVNATWSPPWTCEGQTFAGQPNDALCSHPAVELKPGDSVVLNLEVEMPNSLIAPSGSDVTCGYVNKVAIEEAAAGTQQNTDASDDTATAKVTFAPFEKHGTQYCGADDLTTPPPPSTCPQGWSKTPVAGKCCPPRSAWNGKRCDKGDPPDDGGPTIVTPPPSCKRQSCDRGEVWNADACQCVDRKCPDGTSGRYPNCKPIACPSGYAGKPPNCEKIVIVDPPRCKRKSCGERAAWDQATCSCITKTCPQGTVGTYPRCKPKSCPDGFIGSPPNCKPKPQHCPPGTVGKYPNCRKLPTTCGPGFRGTPPNCKKIVAPPRVCPPGTRGKFPACRPIKPTVQPPRGSNLKLPGGGRPLPGTRSATR